MYYKKFDFNKPANLSDGVYYLNVGIKVGFV